MILELIQATPGGNLDAVVSALLQRGLAAGKCESGRCVVASDGNFIYLFTYSDVDKMTCSCSGRSFYRSETEIETSTTGFINVRELCEASSPLVPSLRSILSCSCDIRFKDGITDSIVLRVPEKLQSLVQITRAIEVRVNPAIPYFYADKLVGFLNAKGRWCIVTEDPSKVSFPKGVKIYVVYEDVLAPPGTPPPRETVVYNGKILSFSLPFISQCGEKSCVLYLDPTKAYIRVLRPTVLKEWRRIAEHRIIEFLDEAPDIGNVIPEEANYQMPIELIGKALSAIGDSIYDRLASCIMEEVGGIVLNMQFVQNIPGLFQFDPWSIETDVGRLVLITPSGTNMDLFACVHPPCTFERTGILKIDNIRKLWDLINSGGEVHAKLNADYFPPESGAQSSRKVSIPFSFRITIPPDALDEAKRIQAMLKGNNPPPDTARRLNELSSGGGGGAGVTGTGVVATASPTVGTQIPPAGGGTMAPTVGTQAPPTGGGGGGSNVEPVADKIVDKPSIPKEGLRLEPGKSVTLKWRGANKYKWTFTVGNVYITGPISKQLTLNYLAGQTQQDIEEVSATLTIGPDAAQAYNTLKSLDFTIYIELIVEAWRTDKGKVGGDTFYVVI